MNTNSIKEKSIKFGYMLLICGLAISCNSKKGEANSDTQKESKTCVLSATDANVFWDGHYDTLNHIAHHEHDWAGSGWQFGDDKEKPSADFSQYEQLVVDINNFEGEKNELILNVRYTTTDKISSVCMPVINGHVTLHVDLDSIGKSHVLEAYVMSKMPCRFVLGDAVFKALPKYGKEKELKQVDGFIDGSEVENYSDDALISFKFFAEGEMTYVSDSGTVERMDNWGIGAICSAADIIEMYCPQRSIVLSSIGEQSYDCRLGDIKYMLDLKDDDGKNGFYWVVWTGGNLTDVHTIKTTIKDVIEN